MIEAKGSHLDAQTVLNAVPGCYLILLPDNPHYTIVAATDSYLDVTYASRNEIIGLGVFQAFPANTDTIKSNGVTNLLASLDYVLKNKKAHKMPDQRYDTINSKTGNYELKIWSNENKPVFDRHGNIEYIIHWVEDITSQVELESSEKAAQKALKESEISLRNIIMHAPVAMCVLKGSDYVVDVANDQVLAIWGTTREKVLHKPIFEGLPEAKNQGLETLLDNVYKTGETYTAFERPVQLPREAGLGISYLNFVYQALKDTDGKINGILAIANDVTEQVKNRNLIKEREEELKMAIGIAELGTFKVDLLEYTGLYSQRIMEWFGFDESKLPMDVIFSYIHKQDRAIVQEAINQSLISEQHSTHDLTYRVVHPRTGVERHLRSFGKTLFTEDNKPYAIVGIIQDVTHQALYQQQMEETELQLQLRVKERTIELENQKKFISSVLDASLNGVYALEAIRSSSGKIIDFRYLFVNDYIAKTLHASTENIVGQKLSDIVPGIMSSGFFNKFCQVVDENRSIKEEAWFQADKFSGWFDYAMVPIDNNTLVVTVEDVTDRKNAVNQIERQKNLLDNIMNNSPSGITVTEVIRNEANEIIDGRTILANNISEKYTGIPLDMLLTKTTREIDPAIIDSPLFRNALETLRTGETFITQYFINPTGRWLELAVAKMDEDHLVNVFSDVTNIKETQMQLEKYVEELKKSNANLEDFAYAASHDLKEPIRKITYFGDRLKSRLAGKLDSEDEHYFSRMEFAAKRMANLIDDLLVYSHVSRGAALEERIDLNQKLQMVLHDLELLIMEKNAKINAGPLPTIIGHRRQMQQLFQNLISNALKYNKPDERPIITIEAKQVKGNETPIQFSHEDGAKLYHLIEVKDNGIGFDQEDADRIFNVFTRLHTSKEYKGTGIGLSIARKVVENHKGFIWATSVPDQGSVFHILLPVSNNQPVNR